ncbi:sugar diacid utilization regulator [Desulfosporosinus orientis DSM 765]|uniref:Sugar diacid utilization regulator n=1 Tax=Desulfosporosinus orientis (strain ATCC 19365 / DSM 765 / NCIMB 8382 / VKM B-1628 / Singapore I) TaxID=768706 RepID=G7W6A9_DESOD|nr:helix-turn-helix domain-containing protein [Desulfosporosinus orientis]AET68116.1 sugar diacid utilization regulator [Desulfosporosinus orientis DSM 765]
MPFNLPQGITLGHLMDTFNLKAAPSSDTSTPDIRELAIHSLRLGNEEHVLPFPGWEVQLSPEEHGLLMQAMALPRQNPNARQHPIQIHLKQTESAWQELCAKIKNWLEQQQGRILAACEEFYQTLTEDLSNQYSSSVVEKLQLILGYDVFLLDQQLDVLAWAGGRQLPEKPIPFLPPKPGKKSKLSPPSKFVNLIEGAWQGSYQDTPLTWCPLSGQEGVLGYLGLSVCKDKLGSIEHYFLNKTATLLSLELLKIESINENEKQHHRDFLFDLLYNNFDSVEVICSRGKLWGWDFSKPHLVAVGEIQDFMPLPAERQRLSSLITKAMRIIVNLNPGTICLERNDQVVCLFPLQEMIAQSQTAGTAEQFLQTFWDTAETLFPDRKIYFGLGNLYPTAREIHRSFQEARSALEIGRLLYPDKPVTVFNELGIMRLLQRLDHQELEDYRQEILKPLLEFDREGNLELEQTLLTYYLCNGDLNLAAQKLYLHPNTLRYRIKKASEVLDRDVSQINHQLNLFIALQIGRLKGLWS